MLEAAGLGRRTRPGGSWFEISLRHHAAMWKEGK